MDQKCKDMLLNYKRDQDYSIPSLVTASTDEQDVDTNIVLRVRSQLSDDRNVFYKISMVANVGDDGKRQFRLECECKCFEFQKICKHVLFCKTKASFTSLSKIYSSLFSTKNI